MQTNYMYMCSLNVALMQFEKVSYLFKYIISQESNEFFAFTNERGTEHFYRSKILARFFKKGIVRRRNRHSNFKTSVVCKVGI